MKIRKSKETLILTKEEKPYFQKHMKFLMKFMMNVIVIVIL